MSGNIRDYGYGDPGDVVGIPKVTGDVPGPCPNCGCEALVFLKVRLAKAPPLLKVPADMYPVGIYIGCPACPWASPMTVTASTEDVSRPESGTEG